MNLEADSAYFKHHFLCKATLCLLILSLSPVNSLFAVDNNPVVTHKWNANAVMLLLAKNSIKNYRFIERKFYSFLKKPTEIHGVLRYRAPNTLEKNILSLNKNASYRIIGSKLFIKKEGKKERKVLLSHYPEVLALANSIRALFAGKITVLKEFFAIELKGSPENWTMVLTPTDIDLEEKIEYLEIKGEQGRLKQIIIKDTDGDKSILTLMAQ